MEFDQKKVDRILEFTRNQISRSKVMGLLLFRTARLENERKKLLSEIGQYYCDQYLKNKQQFQVPSEISALFTRQQTIADQLRAHYDELNLQSLIPKARERSETPATSSPSKDTVPQPVAESYPPKDPYNAPKE